MQTEGKYNLGYNDIKRFGDLSSNKAASSSFDMSSMMESIFSGDKIDFKKLIMFQMMSSNPMMAAMFMGKMNAKDFINGKKSEESQIGFRGLEHKDNDYLNDVAIVSDVKPNHVKQLDRSERKSIEKGDFTVSKYAVAILDKDGKNITEDFSDIIKEDGGIDLKTAKEKYNKLEKDTENNLTTEGLNSLLKETSVKLDSSNYEKYGIDVTTSSDEESGPLKTVLTKKGEEQIKVLQKQGILTEDNTFIKDTSKESDLKEQINQNNLKETLKDVVDCKNVFVKTNDSDGTDTYSAAKVDRDGKITGIKKNDKTNNDKQIEHTEAVAADKKIKLGTLDDENIKKITTVKKDGSVEINLSKLTPDQYKELQSQGIDYNNAAPLTIIDNAGKTISVRLAGDANIVNLKGKANADINVVGDPEDDKKGLELQINADNDAKISGIKGEKLEHLVVKGGTIDANLSSLENIQAVKIEKAKLTQDLNVINKHNDNVAFNMSDVTTDKKITVNTAGDADVKIANSKIGNLDVLGENAATTLSHTNVEGKLSLAAGKEASLRAYKGSKAGTVTAEAENLNATYNGMTAGDTDFGAVSGKTEMFVSKDSKVEDLNINSDAELVGEDEKTAKSLKDKTDVEKVKKLGTEEDDLSTVDLFKKYFDFNDNDMARYKLDLAQSNYNAQPYGWGATPNANGTGGSNWLTRFFNGWAMGGQIYNQMNGNPYAGFGQQYRPQQPYNPLQIQGGYFG